MPPRRKKSEPKETTGTDLRTVKVRASSDEIRELRVGAALAECSLSDFLRITGLDRGRQMVDQNYRRGGSGRK